MELVNNVMELVLETSSTMELVNNVMELVNNFLELVNKNFRNGACKQFFGACFGNKLHDGACEQCDGACKQFFGACKQWFSTGGGEEAAPPTRQRNITPSLSNPPGGG